MPACEKCNTSYNEGDVICVWCGNLLPKPGTGTPRKKISIEIQKDLKHQLKEIITAHDNGEIGNEEFLKKKKEIAKKIADVKAQKTISRYKVNSKDEHTEKKPSRPIRREKPSKWWYLTPLIFNILGGIIAYFAVRKQDYKMARNLIDFGGLMLLLILVSVTVLPTYMANRQNNETTYEIPNTSVLAENIILEKIFINNSLDEVCQVLGLFSKYSDLQKQENFSSTYKDRYITMAGVKTVETNKDAEGYILQLEHSMGCEVVTRINWDQRDKLLSLNNTQNLTITARLIDFDTNGIIYATDGQIII